VGNNNSDDDRKKRTEVIQRVFRGELMMLEPALVLGVTECHSFRIKARIREEGSSNKKVSST
jgi:hypothetical protein